MKKAQYQEKINKIKRILSTPGIKHQQYIRALELLKKVESEYSKHLETQTHNINHNNINNNNHNYNYNHNNNYNKQYNNVNTTSITTHHTSLNNSSNPDIYKNNFNSEEQIRHQQFLEEQQRRQKQFLEDQQRRRREYEKKINSLEADNINSLDIMNLSPNYNLDELKTSYKRLAIQYHPDRPTGNKQKFQLITKCYMSLLERLKTSQESSKGFQDLKSGYKSYKESKQTSEDKLRDQMTSIFNTRNYNSKSSKNTSRTSNQHIDPNSQSFNLGLFNKLYEKNKLWDPNDDGYEDWFRSGTDIEDEQPELFSDKFNLNIFNTTFNNMKSKSRNSTALTKYNEPQELVCAKTPFTEIDNTGPIEDFSKPADAPGTLQYTDLKKAFTGGCDFINPDEVEAREQYRNVEDLQKSRSNISYNMSPQDRAIYEARQRAKEEDEKNRKLRLQQLDQIQAEHYRNTHQNMIGYASNPDY